jgi:hypothetical protein
MRLPYPERRHNTEERCLLSVWTVSTVCGQEHPAKQRSFSGSARHLFYFFYGSAFSARGRFTALKLFVLHGLCPFLFIDARIPGEKEKTPWGALRPAVAEGNFGALRTVVHGRELL